MHTLFFCIIYCVQENMSDSGEVRVLFTFFFQVPFFPGMLHMHKFSRLYPVSWKQRNASWGPETSFIIWTYVLLVIVLRVSSIKFESVCCRKERDTDKSVLLSQKRTLVNWDNFFLNLYLNLVDFAIQILGVFWLANFALKIT